MGTVPSEGNFTAKLRLAGINPYVDVPRRIAQVLGGATRTPPVLVRVLSNDRTAEDGPVRAVDLLASDASRLKAIGRFTSDGWFRSTLVPSRSGATRLYLDKWMRAVAGVAVGDRVRVTLKLDRGSRELPLPQALRAALDADAEADAAWKALARSRRRGILSYLNFLKTPAALERNVQRTIEEIRSAGPAKQRRELGKILLVHWHESEARDLATALRGHGWLVTIWRPSVKLGDIRQRPPAAVVISLRRLPSHGREVADALWHAKWGREIPIVFFDGTPDKVTATRTRFPGARYTTWNKLPGELARLAARADDW